jgi:eukaryotic-like serine/threonine-protein kinase
MNRTPEQQWSALSALYEEADGLRADELKAWLERLEREGNPLLPQLKLMLDARSHLETDDFLGTLPKLSADAANASDWHEGDRVGPYRLVKPLGEGGMAEVWLAERADGAFKRQVAIKLPYPRPGRETFAARFDRERDILATLRHPHIAGLFDAGVTKEGQAWLALEYVEGQPISTFCDERKLPVRERVQLFRQVLLAVQHAHANLVIHRDLKPGNILVTSQGEVRLLDFGIAKLLEAQGDAIEETELTRQAGRSLTPRYASPEQLMGLPLTTACDVYSLGVVFYELVCGERPYELKTESPAQLEHAILEVDPRAPSRRHLRDAQAHARGTSVKGLRKLLVPELDAIALHCMEKKPSARYSSMDAVLADVDRWLAGEAVLARAPGAWYRFGKFARRHQVGVALGTLAVLALVATVQSIQARQESARAIAARDFMLGLFKRADQEKSRGSEISARELLERGKADLTTRLNGQPQLQAELLLGIGMIQMDMGEYANADSTLADATRIYFNLGLVREGVLAEASCADNAMRLGDLTRAGDILAKAKSHSQSVSSDREVLARLNEVDGWIANLRGDPNKAASLFAVSRDQIVGAFGPQHPRAVSALRGLIYAHKQLGNFEEALRLQAQTEAGSVQQSPRERVISDGERADLLQYAGHYLEELRHVEASLPRCVEALGPNDEGCRRLLLFKITALLRLGLVDKAREELPHFESLIDEKASPIVKNDALILALRIESMAGGSERQVHLMKQVRDYGESAQEVPLNPALKVRALLAVSEAALYSGNARDAIQMADKALFIEWPGRSAPQAKLLFAVGRTLKASALTKIGKSSEALPLLSEAQADLSSVLGRDHPLTRIFCLNRAVTLEREGRIVEALAELNAAESALLSALGPDAPTFRKFQQLKGRISAAVTAQSDRVGTQTPNTGFEAKPFFFFS